MAKVTDNSGHSMGCSKKANALIKPNKNMSIKVNITNKKSKKK